MGSVGFAGHVLAAVVIAAAMAGGYLWIRRRSAALGYIVGAALLLRITLDVALFWISYSRLPLAESLQAGNGFWQFAVDATGYYQLSADAAAAGNWYTMADAVPSPMFINVLAGWMTIVGIFPLAGAFLNLGLYLALMISAAWWFAPANDWRRDLPLLVGAAAYSFAPVILIHGTQPLKDELTAFLNATACLAVLSIGRITRRPTAEQMKGIAAASVLVAASVFVVGGIRWYYGALICGALASTLGLFACVARTTPVVRYLTASAVILALAVFGFVLGSGRRADQIGSTLAQANVGTVLSDFATMTQVARIGFLLSGGGTNVVVPVQEDPALGRAHSTAVADRQRETAAYRELLEANAAEAARQQQAAGTPHPPVGPATPPAAAAPPPLAPAPAPARAPAPIPAPARVPGASSGPIDPLLGIASSADGHLKAATTGLALLFLPTFVVQPVFGVDVPSGRGLRAVADLDTVFLDVTLAAVGLILWRRRHDLRDRLPFVFFNVVLSGTTALLLGYVVTNFGTLWRMRPLVAVPLWLLLIALSPRGVETQAWSRPAGAPTPTAP